MITKVRLKNFKLHEDTSIECLPITIFIGPNNSGKSSVFQALLALRQATAGGSERLFQSVSRRQDLTAEPYIFPRDTLLDLGEFTDVARPGNDRIFVTLEGKFHVSRVVESGDPTQLAISLEVQDNTLAFHRGTIKAGDISLEWEFLKEVSAQRSQMEKDEVSVLFQPTPNFQLLEIAGYSFREGVCAEKKREVIALAKKLQAMPSRFLQSVHPIFALRGFEEWAYPLPDAPTGNLEMALLVDRSLAIASILAYNSEIEERLSDWLCGLLGVGIKVHLVPPKRVIIRTTKHKDSGSATLFANEGSGANQLPFILIPIGLSPPNETLLIAEPEVHLHPKAQADLVKLLLKIFYKEPRQYFLETHSEHILHSFLYAIAKGELTKEQLAIYYFENEQGTARVRRLEIDDQGRVKGGLPGFFEHSLQELSESLESLKNA